MRKWLKERGEWLLIAFLVWFLDVFEQRKQEKERKK